MKYLVELPDDLPAIMDEVAMSAACCDANLKIKRLDIARKEVRKTMKYMAQLRDILSKAKRV